MALDPDLRRRPADRRDPPGRRQLRRHALLARRNALVHRRARLDHPDADAPGSRGIAVSREAESPNRGDRLAAVRDLRRDRDRRPRSSVILVQNATTRWVGLGLDRRRTADLRGLPPPRRPGAPARDGQGAAGVRSGPGARVPAPARPGAAGPRLGRRARHRREPLGRARRADRGGDGARDPARPAAERGAARGGGAREPRARRGPRDRRLVRHLGDPAPRARPERGRGDRSRGRAARHRRSS